MKRIAALIMGFVLMTVLVAPASAKELVVAHDTNFMPFEFKGPDGKFTGFDIELWETIAKKLGLSYKFQPMDFNGIIPGLQTGNVDVGIAGMHTRLPPRKRRARSLSLYSAAVPKKSWRWPRWRMCVA